MGEAGNPLNKPAPPDAAVLESRARIEASRGRMSDTILSISAMLSPQHLKAQAVDTAKATTNAVLEVVQTHLARARVTVRATTRDVIEEIREATVGRASRKLHALVAAGRVLVQEGLVLGRRLWSRTSASSQHLMAEAQTSVAAVVEQTQEVAEDTVARLPEPARQVLQVVKRNPYATAGLVLGAIGIYAALRPVRTEPTVNQSELGENYQLKMADLKPGTEPRGAIRTAPLRDNTVWLGTLCVAAGVGMGLLVPRLRSSLDRVTSNSWPELQPEAAPAVEQPVPARVD